MKDNAFEEVLEQDENEVLETEENTILDQKKEEASQLEDNIADKAGATEVLEQPENEMEEWQKQMVADTTRMRMKTNTIANQGGQMFKSAVDPQQQSVGISVGKPSEEEILEQETESYITGQSAVPAGVGTPEQRYAAMEEYKTRKESRDTFNVERVKFNQALEDNKANGGNLKTLINNYDAGKFVSSYFSLYDINGNPISDKTSKVSPKTHATMVALANQFAKSGNLASLPTDQLKNLLKVIDTEDSKLRSQQIEKLNKENPEMHYGEDPFKYKTVNGKKVYELNPVTGRKVEADWYQQLTPVDKQARAAQIDQNKEVEHTKYSDGRDRLQEVIFNKEKSKISIESKELKKQTINLKEENGGSETLRDAQAFQRNTDELLAAPDKFRDYNFWEGVANYAKGIYDGSIDRDNIPFVGGALEAKRYARVAAIINKSKGDIEKLNEEERVLLNSYLKYTEALATIAPNYNEAYKIGEMSGESAAFMAEMFAFDYAIKFVGKGMALSAAKIAEYIAKLSTGSKTARFFLSATEKGLKGGAKAIALGYGDYKTGKLGTKIFRMPTMVVKGAETPLAEMGAKAAGAAVQTFAMSNYWTSRANAKVDAAMEGRKDLTLKEEIALWYTANTEVFTEAALNTPNGVISEFAFKALGRITPTFIKTSKIMDRLIKSQVARNAMRFQSGILKGTPEELLEEYEGAAINWLGSYLFGDPTMREDAEQLFTLKGSAEMVGSMAFQTIVMGGVQTGIAIHKNREYVKNKETFVDALAESMSGDRQMALNVIADFERTTNPMDAMAKINILGTKIKLRMTESGMSEEEAQKATEEMLTNYMDSFQEFSQVIDITQEAWDKMSEEEKAAAKLTFSDDLKKFKEAQFSQAIVRAIEMKYNLKEGEMREIIQNLNDGVIDNYDTLTDNQARALVDLLNQSHTEEAISAAQDNARQEIDAKVGNDGAITQVTVKGRTGYLKSTSADASTCTVYFENGETQQVSTADVEVEQVMDAETQKRESDDRIREQITAKTEYTPGTIVNRDGKLYMVGQITEDGKAQIMPVDAEQVNDAEAQNTTITTGELLQMVPYHIESGMIIDGQRVVSAAETEQGTQVVLENTEDTTDKTTTTLADMAKEYGTKLTDAIEQFNRGESEEIAKQKAEQAKVQLRDMDEIDADTQAMINMVSRAMQGSKGKIIDAIANNIAAVEKSIADLDVKIAEQQAVIDDDTATFENKNKAQEKKAKLVEQRETSAKEAEAMKNAKEYFLINDAQVNATLREMVSKAGVGVEVVRSVSDLPNTAAGENARKAAAKGRLEGFYDTTTNKVYLISDNLSTAQRVRQVFAHEVFAHKGLKELLGTRQFNQFLDKVWEGMSDEAKEQMKAYVMQTDKVFRNGKTWEDLTEEELRREQRAAADEYVAHLAEKAMVKGELAADEKSAWQTIIDLVKEFLNKIFGDTQVTDADIVKMLNYSYSAQVAKIRESREVVTIEEESSEYPDTHFSIVTDQAELDRLNNDKNGYIEAYAYMAKIDGKYYPPMASKVSEDGKRNMVPSMKVNDWVKSDESKLGDNPTMLRENKKNGHWEYNLIKPDGSSMWVAYNPYLHSTLSPLNDQFSAAYSRPELVMVKVRIPKSDLDGYQAEGAKNSVGEMPWKAGPVSSKLAGTENERKVILSRYRQIVGEVDAKDEANAVADILNKYNLSMPVNAVRPQLREELAKLGVKFDKVDDKINVKEGERDTLNKWVEENGDVRFSVTPEMDEEYRQAVESGDMERVSDMLAEVAKKKGYISNEEYRIAHRAPRNDGYNSPLYNVVGMYPEDVYGPNGLRYYGNEGHANVESWNVMRKVRNNPDAMVTIYRTVPASVKESEVRNGDWVTTSREYAEQHRRNIDGRTKIIEQQVPAKYLWTDGNSLSEYGYDDSKTYAHKNTKNGRKLMEPTYDNEGNLIPLSQRFNERKNDVRFSVVTTPNSIFYSNAAKAVESIKQEKATPTQWLAMIEKNGGLKAGEDKWMGLSEWLKGQTKKTLTKDEVMEFIANNTIQVEDEYYSETSEAFEELKKKYDRMLHEEGFDAAQEYLAKEYGDDAQLAFEDLGGELVINNPDAAAAVLGTNKSIQPVRLEYTTEGLADKREIALVVPNIEPYNDSDEIHFGDAGDGRAVAWVRFGETTDTDGNKVLVIDEIQSKRHQDGREKGYSHAEDMKKRGFRAVKAGNTWSVFDPAGKRVSIGLWASSEEEALSYSAKSLGFVPDAPFDKNWHELAMKRMLRYAAENGYDKIAWTTGEQQAARYDIGNVVDKIIVEPHADEYDGKNVGIQLIEGNVIHLNVSKDGIIHSGTEFYGRHIQDVVGKSLADRILSAEENTSFNGDNLRVGDEGMKTFYDKMIPSFMQKYTKKWGGKVGEVELDLPNEANRKMWSVDITPEMKESVMEGQVMFSVITPEQDQEYMDAVNSGDMEKAGEMVKAAFKAAYPNTKVVDENGEPLVVYHGSPRWFTEFKPQTSHANNINTPEGAYFFSKLRDNAQSYTSKKGSVELNPKKIGTRKVLNNNGEYEEIKDIKGGIYSVFLNITNPLIVDYKGNNWSATEMIYEATDWSEEEDAQFKTEEEREKWMNERKSEGHDVSSRRYEQPVDGLKETNIYIDSAISSGRYDGAIFTNIDDYGSYPHSNHEITDEFIAFQPNQIKSAEPVTYDDEGNVIPLSERFSESDDIRYSVADTEAERDRIMSDIEDEIRYSQSVVGPQFREDGFESESMLDYMKRHAEWAKNYNSGLPVIAVEEMPQFDAATMSWSQYLKARAAYNKQIELHDAEKQFRDSVTALDKFNLLVERSLFQKFANLRHWQERLKKFAEKNGIEFQFTPDMDMIEAFAQSSSIASRMMDIYKNTYQKELAAAEARITGRFHDGRYTNADQSKSWEPQWTWQNVDSKETPEDKKRNGKRLTPHEIVSLYLQAKDALEAEQLGLPDRGLDGFVEQIKSNAVDADGNPVVMSAEEVVSQFEYYVDEESRDRLHEAVFQAAKFALKYELDGGLIDKETYDKFFERDEEGYYKRKFYVPERGWAYDEYDDTTVFADPLRAAKGRDSLAADPIEYLITIGNSAILATEKNRVRQSILEMAMANEDLGMVTGAFQVAQMQAKRLANGKAVDMQMPLTDDEVEADKKINEQIEGLQQQIREKRKERRKLKEDYEIMRHSKDTEEETLLQVKGKIEALTNEIKNLGRQMDAIVKQRVGLTYAELLEERKQDRKKDNEKFVTVIKDGKRYQVNISEKDVARNANGLHVDEALDTTLKARQNDWKGNAAKLTRAYAMTKTQLSYNFAGSNFMRDVQFAFMMNCINHNLVFATNAFRYSLQSIPVIMGHFIHDNLGKEMAPYDKVFGEASDLFSKFAELGGITGYSFMQEMPELKKLYKDMLIDAEHHTGEKGVGNYDLDWLGKWIRKNAKKGLDVMSFLSEVSELMTRFGQFRAYLDYAKRKNRGTLTDNDYTEAAREAKNITVNFNITGQLGERAGWLYMFTNATLQGMHTPLRAIRKSKKAKAKFAGICAGWVLAGMAAELFTPDDPDDEKYVPDWMNKTTVSIGSKGFQWYLPHFFRMFYYAGNQMMKAMRGKITWGQASYNAIANLFEDNLPPFMRLMDFFEITNKGLAEEVTTWDFNEKMIRNMSPSIPGPIVDLLVNSNYAGIPIYKEPFNESRANNPIYNHYKNTSEWAIDFSRWLQEKTGGNPDDKSDERGMTINPAIIDYVANQFFTGTLSDITKLVSFGIDVASDGKIDSEVKDIPVYGKFFRPYDQSRMSSAAFYDVNTLGDTYKNLSEDRKAQLKGDEKEIYEKYYKDSHSFIKNCKKKIKDNGTLSSDEIRLLLDIKTKWVTGDVDAANNYAPIDIMYLKNQFKDYINDVEREKEEPLYEEKAVKNKQKESSGLPDLGSKSSKKKSSASMSGLPEL